MATREIRLTDNNYPKEPTDATLNSKGMLILEDGDGERVVLSPPMIKQLFEWLEQCKVEDEQRKAQEALIKWNAMSTPAKKSDGLSSVSLDEYLMS